MSKKIDITRYTVCSERLPSEFCGFKIAHISDLHSRPAEGALEAICAENPDIAVVTGDILHDDDKPIDAVMHLITDLCRAVPVYMVTGNHDVWRCGHQKVLEKLCGEGAVLLNNSREFLEKGNKKIGIYGVCDPFSKLPSKISENLNKSFACLPHGDEYKILLFHRANLFEEIPYGCYDLILSGHMHGGQIRLPRLGGALAPSSALLSGKRMIFPRYSAGRVDYNGGTMIINRGLSNTLPIPRWGNNPEIGLITLKRDTK